MVQGRRVDALIVAHTLDDDPRLAQLQASGSPFWRCRSRLAQPYAWFDCNYAGTCRATRHLIQQVVYIPYCWARTTAGRLILQRRNGYLAQPCARRVIRCMAA